MVGSTDRCDELRRDNGKAVSIHGLAAALSPHVRGVSVRIRCGHATRRSRRPGAAVSVGPEIGRSVGIHSMPAMAPMERMVGAAGIEPATPPV